MQGPERKFSAPENIKDLYKKAISSLQSSLSSLLLLFER